MAIQKSRMLLYLFLFMSLTTISGRLTTHYMSPYCFLGKKEWLYVGNLNEDERSSGILEFNLYSYGAIYNCSVILVPPDSFTAITITAQKLNYGGRGTLTISDGYMRTDVASSSLYVTEYSIFTSKHPGQPIAVIFTSNKRYGDLSFQLVYTAFKNGTFCPELQFHCGNNRCIASKLACDRHNHCGDFSDQHVCGFSPLGIAGIVFGFLCVLVAFGFFIRTMVRKYSQTGSCFDGPRTVHPPPQTMVNPIRFPVNSQQPYPVRYPPAPPPYSATQTEHENPLYC